MFYLEKHNGLEFSEEIGDKKKERTDKHKLFRQT